MNEIASSQRQRSFSRLSLLVVAGSESIRRRTSERGASLVEYSLLIALIAVVVIASVAMFGGAVNENFSAVASEVTG